MAATIFFTAFFCLMPFLGGLALSLRWGGWGFLAAFAILPAAIFLLVLATSPPCPDITVMGSCVAVMAFVFSLIPAYPLMLLGGIVGLLARLIGRRRGWINLRPSRPPRTLRPRG